MTSDFALSSPLVPRVSEKDAKALQYIEEITRNAATFQETVLAEILSRNANSEYLQRYKLGGATDRETFKLKLPVITYEDIKPDIQRMADGDRSAVLLASPISEFLKSSGTSSGEQKLFPSTQEELDRRHFQISLLRAVMNRGVPDLDKGKGLYFLFVRPETRTPGGLLVRPASNSMYKSDHFKTRLHDYTSPIEAILCADSFQSMYTHMLCGLLEREQVLRLGALFASGLLRAMRFLQIHWQALANDIETGTLNQKITDPSIRDCMARILKPRPELAELIRMECSEENWEGIIARIWPNTKYLDAIATGSMAQYIHLLDYYSGSLPIASMLYSSSECFFGLNLNPMCKTSEASYTIMPNMAYFEFLLHDPGSPASTSDFQPPKLVDLVDVEVGKEYEPIITNYTGLYRYKVGDILRVAGFHNASPHFHFVRRKDALLSIDYDKTDEADLQKAVENASRLLREFDTRILEYTSYAEKKTNPGHYVIYWEILVKDPANSPTDDVLKQCCLAMEESLDSAYREARVVDKTIGPLEIRLVKTGTFEELMDYAISRGASINQYKVARCVSSTSILKLLDSRVKSKHFSPSLPHWTT
ncbi:hypothetical protein WN944_028699 [Citrus x changshan-huyou]|uniref:Uncharacterized protein n=1 Tax=Citrus x changshan-huyou TaxID=2935761 RepID=A0AAP0LN86_9ROSI